MPPPDCRLGVDVGGTNTDAVIMDTADRVIAKAKVPGTPDITGGIVTAIDTVLRAAGADPGRISHVMLGTTHATNAVLERSNLRRVAVLRIGGPATYSIRPMFGWPPDLVDAISVGAVIVDGGIEFDGQDLSPLDTDAIARFLGQVGGTADAVAITSVFAPVSPRHELLAAEVVKRELGDVHVSLSHEIGSIGLLERENATILNGALAGVARDVASAMRDALDEHGLRPATFFAQNDGTLMSLDQALRYPVLTIGSGPANSVRGAAFLTGISDSLVVDVGGTSTDLGVLANGFPRESSQGVEIGGIRTNFRMPDLVTIALGGGTVVSGDDGDVRVGPRSVGYLLQQEALAFGGATPTLTDSAIAAGRAAIDGAAPDGADRMDRHRRLLAAALARADVMLGEAIDRVKTSREDCPLIAVGGGSILVPDRIPGVSEIVRPEHFDAANAVGAAIASVSGQVDRIFHFGTEGRQAILDEAKDEARERAVAAGADPDTVQIIEVEEIPLAYLTSPAVRVRVKAAGTLGGVPEHHLQARLAQQARLAGPVTGLDSKPIGGTHETPSRMAGHSHSRRRAGLVAGRLFQLDQPGEHAAHHRQPGVHVRHDRPGDGRRLGPGHRVLRRHHRDERDVRDAHPLQLRHQHRPAAARDQLVVGAGRQDLDLPPPARRVLPHRPPDDGASGQGRDPAHHPAERRCLLRLGRGQDDRHAG
jgi:N-methylhydantoinase A/oxoprolinase/acetone carboxylase beta subunit